MHRADARKFRERTFPNLHKKLFEGDEVKSKKNTKALTIFKGTGLAFTLAALPDPRKDEAIQEGLTIRDKVLGHDHGRRIPGRRHLT